MKTITLPAELAQDLRSGVVPPECGYKVVADYETDTARWAVIRTLVIKDADGRFFAGTYRLGTGDSGERPWEHDDTAEFTEVFARQKTITEYVSADKVPAPEPEPDPSDPRQIAAELIRRQTGHIGRSNVRMRLIALQQEAGVQGMPDDALVTTVYDLIGTAEITWPKVTP